MKKLAAKGLYIGLLIVFLAGIAPVAYGQLFSRVNFTTGGLYTALAKDNNNNLYVTQVTPGTPSAYQVVKYPSGSSTGSVIYSGLTHKVDEFPWGLAVTNTGDVYVSTDFTTSSGAIIKLAYNSGSNTYTASTFQTGRYFTALAFDSANNLYDTEYDAAHTTYAVVKYAANSAANSAGTVLYDNLKSAAGYTYPTGLAVAASGDVYVADAFSNTPSITDGGHVYKLSKASSYTATSVSTGQYSTALALDASGNLFSAENSGSGYRLVKYTAGGGTGAPVFSPMHTNGIYYPWGIAIINADRIFAIDGDDHVLGGAVMQLTSSNAALSTLAISSGTLSPAFATGTVSYTANVVNAVTSVTVTPTVTDAGATIKVNGTAVTSGTVSGPISLNVGANPIQVVVTAADNITTKTYTVVVTRAPSTNAVLATINLNPPASLAVVSGPGYANYTTTVAATTNSLTVKATEQDPTATLTVNGVATASGVASQSIALSPGANVITIVSTAQDGVTKKTYIITVTKPVSANLSALSISAGTLSPTFATGTIGYTASVANAVNSITVTPTTVDATATVTVNGTAVTSGTASGAISLSAGPNTITIVVTGQDGTTTKTYTVTVTRAPSTDAVLATINLNPAAALTVVTGPGYANYTTTVAGTTNSITVKATEQDPTGTLKINGIATASGTASAPITLSPGSNVITVVSTAQDGVTTKTYIITITKPVSANLSALSISAGTLSPAFATGTISYTASVLYAVNAVTVTPTTVDATATVKVNGTAVTSGTASQSIPLSVGQNVITILVTGQDGTTTKTYTVTVTRAAPSTNAVLATINFNPPVGLTVVTGPGYANYTTTVAGTTNSVTITATEQDATATLKINGVAATSGSPSAPIAISPGANVINIVSTAQDGVTTKTYIITVTKPVSANLSALTVNGGALTPLTPAFATGTISYTASVLNAVSSVTVTPTTIDATATVKVNGTAVTEGTASQSIPLSVGPNAITIVVTGQDGTTTKTYTVTVTRSAPSTNAVLATINLNPAAALTVVTGPGYANYTTTVAGTTNSITITATEQDATATLKINGVAATSGSPSAPIALSPGANVINIVSTAQDGVTTKTYIITVTKPVSANLSALSLSAGTLSPAFATGTISYTASVLYAVNSVTVTPTTIDATATVKVNGTAVTEGTASQSIPLNVGQNTITVLVTGQDGTTTKTYTLTVTRGAPSTDALLATINLTPAATLTVVTGPSYVNYTTTVAAATSSITIKATEQDATATLKINGVATASGVASAPITLAVGTNVINIVSTAQDGITTKTYTITATRPMQGADSFYENGISITQPVNEPIIVDDGIVVHPAVSPNGDGINDYLTIENIDKYPENHLTIVDRNGILVYEAKGYDNAARVFDGHASTNGKLQQAGTYFYSLTYTTNGQTRTRTGFIILRY